MSTMDEFAPYQKKYGCFIVRNICSDRRKTIKIFNYPINFNQTRDLLAIPGVAEADIRASLLKGELRHKILAGDIVVECSDIDLLQFNDDQKAFLQSAGITIGLEAGFSELEHDALRQLIHFINEGPGTGFASGAYKEILPVASPFPTSVTWYSDSTKAKKIVEKILTYNPNRTPATITWKMYDVNNNIIVSLTDTIAYSGQFEISRTRTYL